MSGPRDTVVAKHLRRAAVSMESAAARIDQLRADGRGIDRPQIDDLLSRIDRLAQECRQ